MGGWANCEGGSWRGDADSVRSNRTLDVGGDDSVQRHFLARREYGIALQGIVKWDAGRLLGIARR